MSQIVLFSAVVPSLLLVWYFHHRDKNPEPWKTVWASFFLGVLMVIPILLVDAPIMDWTSKIGSPYARAMADAFITAGCTEEFFKFLVLVLFAMRRKAFDEPMDGIVYGAIVSLGFATLENILYVGDGGLGVAIIRAVTAVPGHACFGAIMGYFVAQYRFRPGRPVGWLVAGFFVPALVHSLYDVPLLTMKYLTESGADSSSVGVWAFGTLTVLVCLLVITVRLVRKLRREQDQVAVAMVAQVPMSMGHLPLSDAPNGHAFSDGNVRSTMFVPLETPAPSSVVAAPIKKPPIAGYVMLVLGGILATVGSLFLIALLAGANQGQSSWSDAILSICLLAVPPFFLGLFLFHRGLKKVRTHAS